MRLKVEVKHGFHALNRVLNLSLGWVYYGIIYQKIGKRYIYYLNMGGVR